jgi:hypothetical protein
VAQKVVLSIILHGDQKISYVLGVIDRFLNKTSEVAPDETTATSEMGTFDPFTKLHNVGISGSI